MPSSFTQNTGIELIADGEQTGLWGQTTNNNFDIVDRAANGVGFITLSSTALTLTTSSGVLSDGQFSTLVFSGTPGGTATVTVAPDTAQKTYSVRNQTDQTVVFTQGSGGNVSLPAGRSAVIACTGVGASSAVFDITALMNTATSANTANAVVQRDGSGGFAAGTASLAGLSLGGTPLTASATELNTLDGIDTAGAGFGYVPQGGIIMWSGSVASIPTGWLLCDGTNGTPNLLDRFVVGAGSVYTVGQIGGDSSVTLTEANLPSHTHGFSATTGGQSNDHAHFLNLNTNASGDHTHNFFYGVRNVGGSTPGGYGASFFGTPIGAPSDPGITENRTRGDMVQAGGNHAHNVQGNTAGASTDHTHTVSGTTGATGGSAAHENRPPFFALAYIMKA